jgi:hypothetical protein
MTEQPRTCPGPSHACMAAFLLLPSGAARHPAPLPCVACGRYVTLARYTPDGAPGGHAGHLCRLCDPFANLTPDERNRK